MPTQQKVKRQFHYAVGNTGAEIRFPSIPQIKIGWRLLSFTLFVASLAMVYLLLSAPAFLVQGLESEGLVRLSPADLNSVLDVNGKSIVWLDPIHARTELMSAFPELKELKILVSLPNHIRFIADERQPVLAWQMEDKAYWLDNEGVLIPERGDPGELLVINANTTPPIVKTVEVADPLPVESVVSGENESSFSVAQIQGYGDQVDPAVVDAAFKLSLQIPAGSKILYNNNHGLGWKSEGGWDVFVGFSDDIEYKLIAYEALMSKLSEEGITPSMVSIEHLHAPYYRE
jgi:hypothetical protein